MIIASFVGVTVPVLMYFTVLYTSNFSTDSSHWSNFGDFFGGVVGTFISVLNLILFLIVTKLVASLEKKVSINEMRSRAYENLVYNFDKLVIDLKDSNNPTKEVLTFRRVLNSFLVRTQHLFPFLLNDEAGKSLLSSLDKYSILMDKYQKNFSNKTLENEAIEGLSIIENKFDIFASELQKFILHNV